MAPEDRSRRLPYRREGHGPQRRRKSNEYLSWVSMVGTVLWIKDRKALSGKSQQHKAVLPRSTMNLYFCHGELHKRQKLRIEATKAKIMGKVRRNTLGRSRMRHLRPAAKWFTASKSLRSTAQSHEIYNGREIRAWRQWIVVLCTLDPRIG